MKNQISIIFAVDSNFSRMEHLEWAKKRYAELLPDAEVIIGEDDSNKSDFCKSRAINNGAEAAKGDILIIVDLDMIIEQDKLIEAIELVKDTQYGMICTHQNYGRLKRFISTRILNDQIDLNKHNFNASEYERLIDITINHRNGGIQIVTKHNYNIVNGYNEKFVGYGGEDVAFNIAIEMLCGKIKYLDGTAYHLYHERQNSFEKYATTETHNKQLQNEYIQAYNNKDQSKILRLIKNNYNQKIDFYAPEPHYCDHMVKLWNNIPKRYLGKFYVGTPNEHVYIKNELDTVDMLDYIKNKYNITATNVINFDNSCSNLLLVAAVDNRSLSFNRNMVCITHGAGQSFIDSNGNRRGPGADNRQNVRLFLNPNEYSHKLNNQKYPHSISKIVGCSKLDEWHQKVLMGEIKKQDTIPVIAISFHFNAGVAPEAKSSFEYYKSQFAMLAHKNISKEWIVLGHGHPRMMEQLEPYYKEHGIEVVHDFEEIMERADLYIMDHMSTLYEFASTGRPVVVLNAPWYRRNVEHGLRFWECADVGVNVEYPNELEQAIYKALEDPLEQKMKRERALTKVYAYRDGMATDRVVEAIVKFLETNEYKTEDMREKRSSQGLNRAAQKSRWFR